MNEWTPDWNAVIETMQRMYPMQFQHVVQAVRIDELSRENAELREQLDE